MPPEMISSKENKQKSLTPYRWNSINDNNKLN